MADRLSVLVLNQIAAAGLSRLPAEHYRVGKDLGGLMHALQLSGREQGLQAVVELVAAVDAGDYDRLADAIIQAQLELRTICCECLGQIPGEFSDGTAYCSRNCYEAGGL